MAIKLVSTKLEFAIPTKTQLIAAKGTNTGVVAVDPGGDDEPRMATLRVNKLPPKKPGYFFTFAFDLRRAANESLDKYLRGREVWIWRDCVFLLTADRYGDEEAELLVKNQWHKHHKKLERLKKDVHLREKIERGEISPRNRGPISEDVKAVVWRRDEGKCVKCGSQEDLQFDHIIPFSKGGGDTVANLQILCGPCNREKSDRI